MVSLSLPAFGGGIMRASCPADTKTRHYMSCPALFRKKEEDYNTAWPLRIMDGPIALPPLPSLHLPGYADALNTSSTGCGSSSDSWTGAPCSGSSSSRPRASRTAAAAAAAARCPARRPCRASRPGPACRRRRRGAASGAARRSSTAAGAAGGCGPSARGAGAAGRPW